MIPFWDTVPHESALALWWSLYRNIENIKRKKPEMSDLQSWFKWDSTPKRNLHYEAARSIETYS